MDLRRDGRGGAALSLPASWPTYLAGLAIGLISLAHIPPSMAALYYFDPPKRLLWGILALILALAGSIRVNRLGRIPLCLAFGLLGWMGVRTVFRPVPTAELEVLFTWMLPVVFLILGAGLRRSRGTRFLAMCLLAAGGIQAILMVLQRLGLDPLFAETTAGMAYAPGRMVGTIGYQNQAVDFLALTAAGICMAVKSPALRLSMMAGLVFVAGLTGNRGGVVALLLALVVSQGAWLALGEWSSKRSKRMVAAVMVVSMLAVVVGLALIPETGSRFRELTRGFSRSPAARTRTTMARIAWGQFAERPLTGWGAGEYAFQYLDRLGASLPGKKTHRTLQGVVFAREAHNDPLQFAVEFGGIGLLLMGGLLGVGAVRLVHAGRPDAEPIAGILFVASYMAVSSCVSFPWQTSMAGPLAGFLIGWMWPGKNEPVVAEANPAHGRGRRMAFVMASGLLVGLAFIEAAWFAHDAYLNLALPAALARGGPAEADQILPRWAYRHHALVGAAYAVNREWSDAEHSLEHAASGYQDVLLWNNLGHVQGRLGKWDEALETYEKWARCGVDHPAALLNSSIAYEQTGRLKEAAETLESRNALFRSSSLDEIKRLAMLQMQSGDYTGARMTLESYQRKWSGTDSATAAEFSNLMGAIALASGDRPGAGKWFRSALEHNPELESAKRNLDGLANDSANSAEEGQR